MRSRGPAGGITAEEPFGAISCRASGTPLMPSAAAPPGALLGSHGDGADAAGTARCSGLVLGVSMPEQASKGCPGQSSWRTRGHSSCLADWAAREGEACRTSRGCPRHPCGCSSCCAGGATRGRTSERRGEGLSANRDGDSVFAAQPRTRDCAWPRLGEEGRSRLGEAGWPRLGEEVAWQARTGEDSLSWPRVLVCCDLTCREATLPCGAGTTAALAMAALLRAAASDM
mmetsp:Transcript_101281/g.326862  ORF Transcript_101281/g.326862 Transcript_101281/m.326862 type:complete len:229 (-) Transcript_101281:562-1248(-)